MARPESGPKKYTLAGSTASSTGARARPAARAETRAVHRDFPPSSASAPLYVTPTGNMRVPPAHSWCRVRRDPSGPGTLEQRAGV